MSEVNEELESIGMPAPTAWPMVSAAGVALAAVGIATNPFISVAGVMVLMVAIGGWLRELTPGRGEIEETWVPVDQRAREVVASSRRVAQPRAGLPGNRSHFPERVHTYASGVVGGLLGGGVMAGTAVLYGVVSGRGIWYPINMLAGIVLTRFDDVSKLELERFSLTAFIIASLLHLTASALVGLFFEIVLPTLPKSPVFWGGVVAPLMWTGVVYASIGILNPLMSEHIVWSWFIASQFAYGLTMGIYVVNAKKVPASHIEGASTADGRDHESQS